LNKLLFVERESWRGIGDKGIGYWKRRKVHVNVSDLCSIFPLKGLLSIQSKASAGIHTCGKANRPFLATPICLDLKERNFKWPVLKYFMLSKNISKENQSEYLLREIQNPDLLHENMPTNNKPPPHNPASLSYENEPPLLLLFSAGANLILCHPSLSSK
jgi:hypothetical protein